METFFVHALSGGLIMAILAGPLGSIVMWRRMAYFGDAMAHSAILGVGLGALMGGGTWNIPVAVSVSCLCVAGLLAQLEHRFKIRTDSALGILSPTALAAGLTIGYLVPSVRRQLNGYLFGDILAIGADDLIVIGVLGTSIFIAIILFWRRFVAVIAHSELAEVEGINVARTKLLIFVLLGLFVALALEIAGALLIGALLIIPAVTVRSFCKSPEMMAVAASLAAIFAVSAGLLASAYSDIPAGPAIVLTAGAGLVISLILSRLRGA